MSALNGTNGLRITLLHKLLGLGTRTKDDGGESVSTMSSDGILSVDVHKLVEDEKFQDEASDVEKFFAEIRKARATRSGTASSPSNG